MKSIRSRVVLRSVLFAALVAAGIAVLHAQTAPAVKRNIALRQDLSVAGREGVMVHVELPPGSSEGHHTHPAEVFAFVEEGSVTLEREGKPTEILKAGDVFYVAPGQVHQASNVGTATARLSAVFVAEKGKPLTTQAP